jgi:hypothetical protein
MSISLSATIVIILILIPILYFGFKPKPIPGIPTVHEPVWLLGTIPKIARHLSKPDSNFIEWTEDLIEKSGQVLAQVSFPIRTQKPIHENTNELHSS